MAQAMPKVQNTGGIADILSLFQGIQGAFGTGTTKSEVKGTIDPGVGAQSDALMQSILGQNEDSNFQDMIANIMTRAKQEFAPVLGQSAAAGERAYSSTVVQQLGNEAMARATAEAAAAKLAAINKNNALATQLVDTKMQMTGSKSTTSATGASPMGKFLSLLGPAAMGYSKLTEAQKKKKADSGNTPSMPGDYDIGSLFDAANPEVGKFFSANPSIANSMQLAQGSGEALSFTPTGFDEFAALFSGPQVSAEASTLIGPTGTATFGAETAGIFSGVGEEAALATSMGEAGIFTGAVDAAGAGAAELGIGAGAAVGAGEIAAGAGAAELAGAAIAAEEGIGLAEVAVLLSAVICTELMKQGILKRELWMKGKWYTPRHLGLIKEGYHLWAIPYVRLMQKYSLATKLIAPLAIGRYTYLYGKWNFWGFLSVYIGEPFCISLALANRAKNWLLKKCAFLYDFPIKGN